MTAKTKAAAKSKGGRKLTAKQEAFCLAYIEADNASAAYRQIYNAEKMKPETVNRKAKELLDNGKVAARVKELQDKAAKRNEITVDRLLSELEEARQLAKMELQPSAMVSATMGKAKITGHDKQVIEHTGKDGGPIRTKSDDVDLSKLSDSALAELMAARHKDE